MATETPQPKAATKHDKDAPTIEVKEETSIESPPATTKETPKPPAAKEESKPAPAKEVTKTGAAKEEAKTASTAAKKDEPKPAAAKETPKPAPAAKDEPKQAPAAAPAAKDEPKQAPAAKDEPKQAPAAKDEPKQAPAAKDEPKQAPAAAKEEPNAAPARETPRPAAPKPSPTVDTVSRVGRAEAIVRRNVLWSLGAGVVPFPVFDAIAIAGVQLKMLSELSDLYKVDFTESIAKKLIGSLASSIGSVALGSAVGSSLVKLVPGVGTALGIVSVPLIGGAATHATGKVFIMHFEAGGTLLDFDPHKMRSYFKQEFDKAKQSVAEMHKNEQAKGNKTS